MAAISATALGGLLCFSRSSRWFGLSVGVTAAITPSLILSYWLVYQFREFSDSSIQGGAVVGLFTAIAAGVGIAVALAAGSGDGTRTLQSGPMVAAMLVGGGSALTVLVPRDGATFEQWAPSGVSRNVLFLAAALFVLLPMLALVTRSLLLAVCSFGYFGMFLFDAALRSATDEAFLTQASPNVVSVGLLVAGTALCAWPLLAEGSDGRSS